LEAFKSSSDHLTQVHNQLASESDPQLITRLKHREYFFTIHSTPEKLKELSSQIIELEKSIDTARSNREV
jgi:hypothetical protein